MVPSLVNTVRYAKLIKEHVGGPGPSSQQSTVGAGPHSHAGQKVSFRQFLTVMVQIADTGFPSLGTRLLDHH